MIPTGKPFTETILRNQPFASPAAGQLTDYVFVNTEAIPFAMFMDAMEIMNGGTDM